MKNSKSQKNGLENNAANKVEQKDDFLIVGIGASAGGIQALKTFLKMFRLIPGAAYVVILHLSPDHESKL